MHTLSFRHTINVSQKSVATELLINNASTGNHYLEIAGLLFGGQGTNASYDLFTCSCGVPGCAGFHEPITQTRTNGQVLWAVPDEKTAKLLGADHLVFDAAAFDAAIAALYTTLLDFEGQGIIAETLIDENGGDEGEERTHTTLENLGNWARPYFAGQTALHNATAHATTPILLSWHRDPNTHQPTTPTTLTVGEAAALVLNIGNTLDPNDAQTVDSLNAVIALLDTFAHSGGTGTARDAFAPHCPDVYSPEGMFDTHNGAPLIVLP